MSGERCYTTKIWQLLSSTGSQNEDASSISTDPLAERVISTCKRSCRPVQTVPEFPEPTILKVKDLTGNLACPVQLTKVGVFPHAKENPWPTSVQSHVRQKLAHPLLTPQPTNVMCPGRLQRASGSGTVIGEQSAHDGPVLFSGGLLPLPNGAIREHLPHDSPASPRDTLRH